MDRLIHVQAYIHTHETVFTVAQRNQIVGVRPASDNLSVGRRRGQAASHMRRSSENFQATAATYSSLPHAIEQPRTSPQHFHNHARTHPSSFESLPETRNPERIPETRNPHQTSVRLLQASSRLLRRSFSLSVIAFASSACIAPP